MNSVYLSEAFKELKLLNEAEEYNLSSDPESVKDAVKMLDDDEFSIKSFDVVDGEANNKEDLQDSYEGKVILECTICHSMSYHDKEDVIIDEETGYANIDEECPFCCTEGGFKIIGQVAPYVTAEEELNVEAEEPEKVEESFDGRNVDNNKLKKALKADYIDSENNVAKIGFKKYKVVVNDDDEFELYDVEGYDLDIPSNKHASKTGIKVSDVIKEAVESANVLKESLIGISSKALEKKYYDIVDRIANSMYKEAEEYDGYMSDGLKHKADKDALIDLIYSCISREDLYIILLYITQNFDLSIKDDCGELFEEDVLEKFEYLYGDVDKSNEIRQHKDGMPYKAESLRRTIENIEESCNKKVSKEQKQSELKEGWRGCDDIEMVWHGEWSDPDLVWNGYTFNYWDIEDALWSEFLEDNGYTDSDADNPKVEEKFNKYVQDRAPYYLMDVIDGGYFIDESSDWHDMYSKKNESFVKEVRNQKNESVQSTTIETDTDTITVLPSEDGSMTVTTETKDTPMEGAEMIVPLDPEVEMEIENNEPEDEEGEEEGEKEVDIPIDDFDEEAFDELGESYLKQVYENVNSYKTESIREDGNKLVIEGMINFNSGNNKKTSFIFEAKDVTKSGKVRFIGENKQISRGKKAFTMTGKVNEGKFISESLNYNYRAKDTEGKSNRMYGTVRTNK